MSIAQEQNIYGLQPGFTASRYNAFPVSQDEAAQPYWNGYEYAPKNLGETFAATTSGERLTPTGEDTINGAVPGADSYGPVSKMSNDQHSILTSMATMIATAQGTSDLFAAKTGPQQMKATWSKSSSLKSTKLNSRVPGTDITTSGVPVPQYTDRYQYGTLMRNPKSTATLDSSGRILKGDTDGEPSGWNNLGMPDFVGDRDKDGDSDFNDFFIFADIATPGEDDQGRTTLSIGGEEWFNTHKGNSAEMGINALVSRGQLG